MDVQSLDSDAVPHDDVLIALHAWYTAIGTTSGVAATDQRMFTVLIAGADGLFRTDAAYLVRLETALTMIADVATHAAANDPQAPAAVVLTTIASTARLALHGRSR